jgi:hypothetical protein
LQLRQPGVVHSAGAGGRFLAALSAALKVASRPDAPPRGLAELVDGRGATPAPASSAAADVHDE